MLFMLLVALSGWHPLQKQIFDIENENFAPFVDARERFIKHLDRRQKRSDYLAFAADVDATKFCVFFQPVSGQVGGGVTYCYNSGSRKFLYEYISE